jgi:hypothetical protein
MNESVMNFNSKKVKTDYKTREKTVSITLTSTKHMLRIDWAIVQFMTVNANYSSRSIYLILSMLP